LTLDNSFDNELFENFQVESNENLDLVEEALLTLEEDGCDDETINCLFRAIHSVKGGSAFLNLHDIERLSHSAESLLGKVRDKEIDLTTESINVLLESIDLLKKMLQSPQSAESENVKGLVARLEKCITPDSTGNRQIGNAQEIFQNTLQDTARIGGLLQNVSTNHQLYSIYFDPSEAADNNKIESAVLDEMAGQLDSIAPIVEPASNWGTLLREGRAEPVFVTSEYNYDKLSMEIPLDKKNILQINKADFIPRQKSNKKAVNGRAAPEHPADVTSVVSGTDKKHIPSKPPATPGKKKTTAPSASNAQKQTIRLSVSVLDELLELIGGVVLGRNQCITKFDNDPSFNALSQSITKLHQQVIQTRMQPIGTIFEKFKRTVRDLSKKLDKKIELHIEGGEIELDRTILEALSDPLTHLVRNSADHGIDTMDERTSAGKQIVGNIHLRAYHESGQILIEVEDDGRGINYQVIKAKALEKGIISPEQSEEMTEHEIINLIFHPGFSTRDTATEMSGRGVGMDVVRTNLEKLGCEVDIQTTFGKGTLVSARIPLTQAIVNSSVISGLIIQIGSFTLAIPQLAVSEIIRLSPEDKSNRISTIKGQEVFKLRDKIIPLVHLEDILDIPRTYIDPVTGKTGPDKRVKLEDRRGPSEAIEAERRDTKDRRKRGLIFLVLQYKQDYFGVLVDKIVGTEEIVVKRLPRIIKHRRVFAGSTVLGRGRVSLILDINGMVEKADLRFDKKSATSFDTLFTKKESNDVRQQVIIFNNAEEEFFAIPVNLLSEIDRFEVKEIQRVGKKEFIRRHGMSVPLLRLENHLEVNPITPREKNTVIIPTRVRYATGIVANKLIACDYLPEDLNTLEADERGILGTFFYQNKMITLLDIFALLHNDDPTKYKGMINDELQFCRLLFVEDQPFFRQLVSQYFRSFGIRNIVIAEDGEEALGILHKQHNDFDLVVSDIEMPRMNGYQLVSNIKSTPAMQHLPVMALTSLAGEDHERRGKESGFDAYEVKIDKERVIRTLNELYRKSKAGIT